MSMRSKCYWKAEQRQESSYFTLSVLSISHSRCWTIMYRSFPSNGCLAAGSGCCVDGGEAIIISPHGEEQPVMCSLTAGTLRH